MTDKELQDLIRLKRYEQPEEGYFEDFLQEFQQRQRSEMLNTSARGLFVERVKARFAELGSIRWVIGAGAAYAAVALVFKAIPDQTSVAGELVVAKADAQTQNERVLSKGELAELEKNGVEFNTESILATSFMAQGFEESDLIGLAVMRPVDFTDDGPAYLEESRLF